MNRWQNMGVLDRVVRAGVGLLALILGAYGGLSPLWSTIAYVVTVLMIATAAVGICPAYLPFRIDTRPRTPRPA